VVWLGHVPEMTLFEVKKGGKKLEMAELEFYDKKKDWQLQTTAAIGQWIMTIMPRLNHLAASAIDIQRTRRKL
jgi:hypothetical protein